MTGGHRDDGGPVDERLDVDDPALWNSARRPPLSAEALNRIAARVKSERQPRVAAGPRWRVFAAASLLLLVGGAAGAGVATFVIRRPSAGAGKDAAVKTMRPPAPSRAARERVAPPPPENAPPAAVVEPPPPPSPIVPRREAAPVRVAMRAPVVTAPPVVVPPPSAVPPSLDPPPPSGAGAEAGVLRAALAALNREQDPAAALALLDQYDARYPKGTLRGEATLARARILRELGRDDDLLRLLERGSFAGVPRAAELRVLRGELRMTRGRFAEALDDFEATLVAGGPDTIVERALFGRASCRLRLHDADGARADLRRYLERFPASPRAAEVRASLAR